jgi:hypothetical protein
MGILYQRKRGQSSGDVLIPLCSLSPETGSRSRFLLFELNLLYLLTVGLLGGGVLPVVMMNVVVDLGSHVLFPVFVDDGVIIPEEKRAVNPQVL